MTTKLTEGGKRLADALDATWPGGIPGAPLWIEHLNAAALLLNAPEREGAGLREAAQALLSEYESVISWRDPNRHESADRHPVVVAMKAALTKRPAAQEPAAVGVDDAAYEAAWNEYRWMGGPGYTDSSASTAFLEGWNAALRATLTPAAPKTPDAATGGSVGPGSLREALATVRDRIVSPVHGGISDTFWMTPTQTVVDFIDAALSTAPAVRPGDEVERVRHVKSGTEYEVLGEAEAQVSVGPDGTTATLGDLGDRKVFDGCNLTVYRNPKSRKLWCRFTDEFRDGRFVPAAAPAADGGQA